MKKTFLIGFALMLKREALDSVGLLDERFSPGQFEDDDLGIRLNYAGWQTVLCDNSFIFHYISGMGKNHELWLKTNEINAGKFIEKWKFDIGYYTFARHEIISLIKHDYSKPIQILEVGCGLGATLTKIKYLWPNSFVYGIEIVERIAHIGANYLNIIPGNIESMELPYASGQFDYIILADVIEHLHEPEETLRRLIPYLKTDGSFLCSIPNIMHISVISSLLQGRFDYADAGICDKTHLRFFTLDSIVKLFQKYTRIEELTSMLSSSPTAKNNRCWMPWKIFQTWHKKSSFKLISMFSGQRKKQLVIPIL